MHSPELDAAFRATTYRVETLEGCFALRVDQRNVAFDAYLRRQGVLSWGLVTGHNPGGRLLPSDENATRQNALHDRLFAKGWRYLPASHQADAGAWPDEAAFCVLNVAERDLECVAAEFDQAAVLCGTPGECARLLWIAADRVSSPCHSD